MTSDRHEIRDALMEAVNESDELFALLNSVPEKVEATLRDFTPVDTGDTINRLDVKHRKTALKKLSTRRVKLGEVFYDGPDQAKWATLEYGRSAADDSGATPAFGQTRKTAAAWITKDL